MKKIAFIFALAAFIFVPNSFSKDFSSFEKSLLENTPKADSVKNDSTVFSNESFEKSLFHYKSENEPIFKAREALLTAIKQKNKEQILEQISVLDGMTTASLVALDDVEKECAYVEANLFDEYLKMILSHYKTIYDPSRFDENTRHISSNEDGLVFYVKKKILDNRDSSLAYYYTIKDHIEASNLSEQDKQKLAILILLRDAYHKKDIADTMVNLINKFAEKYPDDPDLHWMEKSILRPLEKLNLFSFSMKMRKKNKENTIQKKLYTGGFGVNLGAPIGGFSIGMKNFYRKDLYDLGTDIINAELYLQIGRFTALFETTNPGIQGVWGFGFGAGYVAYDSRYLKIRPYVAMYNSGINVVVKNDIPGHALWAGSEETDSEGSFNTYTLAVNVDYKFGTPYLFLSDRKLVSFAVIGKFGLSYLNMNNFYAKGSGVVGFAHIALGVYFW